MRRFSRLAGCNELPGRHAAKAAEPIGAGAAADLVPRTRTKQQSARGRQRGRRHGPRDLRTDGGDTAASAVNGGRKSEGTIMLPSTASSRRCRQRSMPPHARSHPDTHQRNGTGVGVTVTAQPHNMEESFRPQRKRTYTSGPICALSLGLGEGRVREDARAARADGTGKQPGRVRRRQMKAHALPPRALTPDGDAGLKTRIRHGIRVQAPISHSTVTAQSQHGHSTVTQHQA